MGLFGFLKFMMFAFNGIIFLAGAAILGVGVWVKVDSGSILGFLEKLKDAPSEISQVLNVGYLLIAIGSVLVLIGFLGCCGAIRENQCMLLLFFVIVLIVFIAEVVGAVVILAFSPYMDKLFEKIGLAAVKSIQSDYGKNDDVTGLWNTTMTTLKCCGFYNVSDFENSYNYNETKAFPPQCCGSTNNTTSCTKDEAQYKRVPGCFLQIKHLVNENAIAIIAVALGIAVLEICAMVVSMVLYCRIKSESG